VKDVVFRVAAAYGVLLIGGCAHVEAPTGGPQLREPLNVTEVRPDSLAVVPDMRGPVVFSFERRLSERGLDDAVMVSPRTGPVVVSHRGRDLRVALREGWQPGRIYHVTVLPAVQDLWNNRLEASVTHVFSTGPRIPETRVSGVAVDRITARPEVDIRVEAISSPDSLVYATRTDSVGAFTLAHIPEGRYQIRAFRDMNRNREMDPFEPRDTTLAMISEAAEPEWLRLRVVTPDTTPPRVASAQMAQQRIEIRFDDHLDPDQPLAPEQVRIVGPDGRQVEVRRLFIGEPPPGQEGGDAPARTAPPAPAAEEAPPGETPAAPPERLPSQSLFVEPESPLQPVTRYTVVVEGVHNVVGLVGGGETQLTTPAAPAAAVPDEPDDEAPDDEAPDDEAPDDDVPTDDEPQLPPSIRTGP
jgi:hypothetical protein